MKLAYALLFALSLVLIGLCGAIGMTATGWSLGFALFTCAAEVLGIVVMFYSIVGFSRA